MSDNEEVELVKNIFARQKPRREQTAIGESESSGFDGLEVHL